MSSCSSPIAEPEDDEVKEEDFEQSVERRRQEDLDLQKEEFEYLNRNRHLYPFLLEDDFSEEPEDNEPVRIYNIDPTVLNESCASYRVQLPTSSSAIKPSKIGDTLPESSISRDGNDGHSSIDEPCPISTATDSKQTLCGPNSTNDSFREKVETPSMPDCSLSKVTAIKQDKGQKIILKSVPPPSAFRNYTPPTLPCTFNKRKVEELTGYEPDIGYAPQYSYNPNAPEFKAVDYRPRRIGPMPDRLKICVRACLISADTINFQISQSHLAIHRHIHTLLGQKHDPLEKSWTIPISEYENFIKLCEREVAPFLDLTGIPSWILEKYSNTSRTTHSTVVDIGRIDNHLRSTLLPFQKNAIEFGIRRNGRILLADGHGCGKTLEALGIAHYYVSEWPLLVIAPQSMRNFWKHSVIDFLPSVTSSLITIVDHVRDLTTTYSSSQVIIIGHELILENSQHLIGKFKVVILDESHFLNPQFSLSQAILPVMKACTRAILISASCFHWPDSKSIRGFHNQLIGVYGKRIGDFFPYHTYSTRYGAPDSSIWRGLGPWRSSIKELQLIVNDDVMIRRTRVQVAGEMMTLTRKQRKLFTLESPIGFLERRPLILAREAWVAAVREGTCTCTQQYMNLCTCYMAYWRETSRQKLNAVKEYVSDLVAGRRKLIVFVYHDAMIEALCKDWLSKAVSFIKLVESTSDAEQNRLVEMFESDNNILIAIVSMKTKLDYKLNSAELIVFAELHHDVQMLLKAESCTSDKVDGRESNPTVSEFLFSRNSSDIVTWTMIREAFNFSKNLFNRNSNEWTRISKDAMFSNDVFDADSASLFIDLGRFLNSPEYKDNTF